MDILTLLIAILHILSGVLLGMLLTRQRRVTNRDRKPTEASRYIVQWNPFNAPSRHSFTSSGIKRAGIRGKKQPEDF